MIKDAGNFKIQSGPAGWTLRRDNATIQLQKPSDQMTSKSLSLLQLFFMISELSTRYVHLVGPKHQQLNILQT